MHDGSDFDFLTHPLSMDEEQLVDLAASIRRFLISSTSETGGHIGANLGTVELTLALHSVFKSPDVPFIFDTGHQGYTHKILTKRAGLFRSLNSIGGMNRFLTPDESVHDLIESSHAGTAISTGLGLAIGRRLAGNADPVVAVVGDSALTEGNSLEALNHAVVESTNLIIVINDNGFAISEGFGGIHNVLQHDADSARKFFEALGAHYVGPVDGHDTVAIISALESVASESKLPIIHIRTEKGRGLAAAKDHPTRMHYSPPFQIDNGWPSGLPGGRSFSDAVGNFLLEQMDLHRTMFCITPSTRYATGLDAVFAKYPSRCSDPGMAEQHAMSLCVGLEKAGMLPVISYQSTFMQRAYDQLVHDLAFSSTKAIILSHRSGLAGYDNSTHHGLYDAALLRTIPGLRIFRPSSFLDFKNLFSLELAVLDGPVVFLLPYGEEEEFPALTDSKSTNPVLVTKGSETLLVSVGSMLGVSKEVASLRGYGLVDLRIIAPLPVEDLVSIAENYDRVVVLEEATSSGGIGFTIASSLAQASARVSIKVLSFPDVFVGPGSRKELLSLHGLDVAGILKEIDK